MIGRHGPVHARERTVAGQQALADVARRRPGPERAHPLAVDAEILVAAIGDEGFGHSRKEAPQTRDVVFEAVAASLIDRNSTRLNSTHTSAPHMQPYA